jgi:hypothetical protein
LFPAFLDEIAELIQPKVLFFNFWALHSRHLRGEAVAIVIVVAIVVVVVVVIGIALGDPGYSSLFRVRRAPDTEFLLGVEFLIGFNEVHKASEVHGNRAFHSQALDGGAFDFTEEANLFLRVLNAFSKGIHVELPAQFIRLDECAPVDASREKDTNFCHYSSCT